MGTAELTDVANARDAAEDAARAARRQLDTARHELTDRAGAARDDLEKRAGTAREAVRDRLDDVDLEPRVRQAKIGAWSLVRAVIGALVAVPGLVTRGLGSLSQATDDAVDRSAQLSARSRKLARRVPVTRAGRRRARARTAAWALGGFAVGATAGVFGGYALGRRPELADGAKETARTTSERARTATSEAVQRVRTAAEERAEAARKAAEAARSKAQETVESARGSVDEATQDAASSVEDAASSVAAAAEQVASDNGEAAEHGTGR